jgi:hypothetical protein
MSNEKVKMETAMRSTALVCYDRTKHSGLSGGGWCMSITMRRDEPRYPWHKYPLGVSGIAGSMNATTLAGSEPPEVLRTPVPSSFGGLRMQTWREAIDPARARPQSRG